MTEFIYTPQNLGDSPTGQRLHHTGFVVKAIAPVIESFCRSVGGRGWTQTWEDPIQKVRVAFILPANLEEACIELVEPCGEQSPTHKILAKGGGLYHLCYEVGDLEQAIREAGARGLTMVRKPQPAVAFDGRRIAWFFSREKLLIEYLEGSATRSGAPH